MQAYHLISDESIEQLPVVERKRNVLELKIIESIYVSGPQSVMALCKETKTSSPNLLSVLNDLLERGIVEKKGRGVSIGGRKPDLYGIKEDCFYVMSVEVGVYTLKLGIYNSANVLVNGIKEICYSLANDAEAISNLIKEIEIFLLESNVDSQKLFGIGISMPGLIDSDKGVNHTYLKCENQTLVELLTQQLQIPVFIENDAKAIALAEYHFGLVKGKRHALVLFLDWGLGLGMILDGKLYRGSSGFAGEFSHIPMVENGMLCRCGKMGCLETIASATSIVRMAEEGINAGKSSVLNVREMVHHEHIDVKNVVDAALIGDQYAINILAEIGRNLGKGISILIQLFNPEIVVLCGKMSEAGAYLTTPLQQSIQTHTMKQISNLTQVEVSNLGTEIGVKGALAVVMENIFEKYIKRFSLDD